MKSGFNINEIFKRLLQVEVRKFFVGNKADLSENREIPI
jgi:hypothetical protein